MSEDPFTRVLERHAEQVRPRHLELETVRTSARRIRRRRRLAASGAAAALVAVALVVPAALGGSTQRSTPDPAPSPTPTPTVRVDAPVPFDGGYLALAAGANPLAVKQRLYRLDADLVPTEDLGPVLPAVAAAADGRTAWTELRADGSLAVLTVAEGDQRQWVELPAGELATPIAFDAGGLVVHRTTRDGEDLGYATLPNESSDYAQLDGLDLVRDASQVSDLVVGTTRYDDAAARPCAGALRNGVRLWERCGFEVVALSPDGRAVVAYADEGTPGHAQLTVLDAETGEPVLRFEGAGGSVVHGAAWEDAKHVLAVVAQDGTQAILRLGTDGSVARSSDALVLDAMSVAWFLGGPPAG